MELPERGAPDTAEPHTDDPTYLFKSSLMGAGFELRLTSGALEWRKGAFSGAAGYDQIRRVRLSYRPMTAQSYRFVAEVWPVQGPKLQVASTSWKSMFEQERLDGAYRAFVTELCRRIGAAAGRTSFKIGTPPLLYWPGLVVFVGASLGLAGLIVRALMTQAWGGAAFIAAFLCIFLWHAGGLFGRNRPGSFQPDAIPEQVLPKV